MLPIVIVNKLNQGIFLFARRIFATKYLKLEIVEYPR